MKAKWTPAVGLSEMVCANLRDQQICTEGLCSANGWPSFAADAGAGAPSS